jgi:hypothetical protein
VPTASTRTKERFAAYLNMGFRSIVEASAKDRKVAIRLAHWLRDRHGFDLAATVVRRWLNPDVDHWQEPRVTVGMRILEWWRDNKTD